MFFRLDINLSEDDYFAFNIFHSFESSHGKKMINTTRLFFILAMVVLAALVFLVLGWTTFSTTNAALLLLFTLLYMMFYKKISIRILKAQIKRLKKMGKLPFEPISTLEFYEDKLVEATPSRRTEQKYDALERICVVAERYVFLYTSSVGAYLLPIAQIKAQLNQEELIDFLSKKCTTVEYY